MTDEASDEMKCPSREQIREAARTSLDVREALEKLFPPAFEERWVPFNPYLELSGGFIRVSDGRGNFVAHIWADGDIRMVDRDHRVSKAGCNFIFEKRES